MKSSLALVLFLVGIQLFGQNTAEIGDGFLYHKDGSKEKALIFDDENKDLQKRVFVKQPDGTTKEYKPEELLGFSFLYDENQELKHVSRQYRGKYYFVQQQATGFYPLFLLVADGETPKYYSEVQVSEDSSRLVWLRDKTALRELVKDNSDLIITDGKYVSKATILKSFKDASERANVPFQEYKRPSLTYFGFQAMATGNFTFVEGNFTIKHFNNFKGMEFHSKFFYYDRENQNDPNVTFLDDQRNRFGVVSGVKIKFSRLRLQPYAFAGAGFNFIQDDDDSEGTVFTLVARLGLEWHLSLKNSIQIELVGTIPTIGYKHMVQVSERPISY